MFLKNVLFLLQEFDRFKSFANSLLSRSNKLSELISDLQAAADYVEKGPDTPEGARVKKSGSKLFHLVTFRWRTVKLINSSIVLGPLPYDTVVATQGSGQPGMHPSKSWRVNSRNASGSRRRWGSLPK